MTSTKNSQKQMPVIMLVMCALFAALTAICAQISIPIQPVPICLSLFAVELCGALLDKKYSVLAIGAYVLLGLVGVPVFSGFKGGAAALFGTTGGYIIGYLFCAFIISFVIEKWGREFWKQAIAMLLGLLVCYLFGTAWFMVLSGRTLAESMSLCVIPFLPGDAVKIVLAVVMSLALYKPMKQVLRR